MYGRVSVQPHTMLKATFLHLDDRSLVSRVQRSRISIGGRNGRSILKVAGLRSSTFKHHLTDSAQVPRTGTMTCFMIKKLMHYKKHLPTRMILEIISGSSRLGVQKMVLFSFKRQMNLAFVFLQMCIRCINTAINTTASSGI